MEQQIIRLEAMPVLKNSIKEAGHLFEQMAIEVGLGSDVVVTSENRPLVKSMVAELTKKYNEFETSRKTLKNELMKDYEELMVVYKEEISDRFIKLTEQAKRAIAASESAEVDEKENSARGYFDEAIAVAGIDYIKFENVGLKINLTVSAKKLREEIDTFIARMQDNENLINLEEFKVEIFTEYKRNGLNASKAILDVKARKQQERLEAKRLEDQRYDQRCSQLRRLGMVSSQIPPMFFHVGKEDINVSMDLIRQATDDYWFELHASLSEKISDFLSSQKKQPEVLEAPVAEAPKPVEKPQAPAPSHAQSETEPTQTLTFVATATITQFKALAAFMRENNIIFKTINS